MKKESKVMQGHLNFSLLAQECHKEFHRRFHRNTLRRWAVREGLYKPSVDPTTKPFHRFEKGGIGMLFQHDSSIHRWVPALQRNTVLIATIDDHSRKIVGARLVPRDTSWHHLCVVRWTAEIYGRPLAYYTDNHMIFKPDTDTHVQFGRALKALEIELKLTGKAQPQAKGKIEKLFDYLQRRIPYLCEKKNITNLTNANPLLDQEVAYYNHQHLHEGIQEIPNQRWERALKEDRSYLRPLPDNVSLDLLFALHYQRVVSKDGFVQFAGQEWPVPEAPRRAKVTVVLRPPTSSRRPHTELTILYPGGSVQFILPRGSAKDHGDFRQDL
jgi:transposase InsO family protein